MSIKNNETSWPTWKLALLVGVPVVAGGVGYYLYTKSKSSKAALKPEESSSAKPQKSPVKPATEEKKVNINNNPKSDTLDNFKKAVEFKNEGNNLFKSGKFDEAIEKYEKAIEICPSNKSIDLSTFYQNKAAAHEKLKQYEKVVEACTKAIELNPRYVKALFRRSRALELLNCKTECLEDITAVCIMEQFQNSASMLFADRVLKDIGKEDAKKKFDKREPFMPSVMFVKQYFSSFTDDIILHQLTEEEKAITDCGFINAKRSLLAYNLNDVLEECTRTIDNCSKEMEMKSNQIHSSGDIDEESQQKLEIDRKYLAHALLLRGSFYLLMGNTRDAKPDLERVIKMDGVNQKILANALIKRGSLKMQEQQPEDAKHDFNLAVEKDPDNTDVLHHRGQLHVLLSDLDSSIKDFERCIEIKPNFALAHAQRCFCVYKKAYSEQDIVETTQAFAHFEEVMKQFPNCTEIYGLYAQALTDKEDFNKADEMFAKAIEIEPDNATQYVHRGMLTLQWKQNMEESVKYIEKALEIDEKCDFAHETMGTIEVQRGNLSKACRHFEVAIDLAKTETEMAHLYSLKAAAMAQGNLAIKYGLRPPAL